MAATTTLSNWNDSAISQPTQVVTARTVADLQAIVTGVASHPSPVRVACHLHSMNACFATTGTQVFLDGALRTTMNLNADGTLTVAGGVTMLEIAYFLRDRGRQLPVMPEIGNATIGSVACCGTKDASVGGASGQVSSAVVGVKMVRADGRLETLTEPNDAVRLREVRSSYGLFGIIYEVTLRTEPLVVMRYTYEILDLNPVPPLAQIRAGADAVLGFMQPYNQRLLVERRTVVPGGHIGVLDRLRIEKRKFIWAHAAALTATIMNVLELPPGPRNVLNFLEERIIGTLLDGFQASRADCMIDFQKGGPYFDFTFWAFPVSQWQQVVSDYLQFVRDYQARTRFQASLFTEVYLIAHDTHATLSCSPREDVFTLDMVDARPNDQRWREMNQHYNHFAIAHGGRPLLNQTKELTTSGSSIVQATLGADWQTILQTAQHDDPTRRFMNDFFARL